MAPPQWLRPRSAVHEIVLASSVMIPLTRPGDDTAPGRPPRGRRRGTNAAIARVSRWDFHYLTAPRPPPVLSQGEGRHWRTTTMDLYPCGSRPSRRGPADSFTGVVWQDPVIEAPAPARIRSGLVRFEPGARTHWHTHTLGQTLWLMSDWATGRTWRRVVREIRAGDVVWIPPGEKHWHGAGPTTVMMHVAMQEALDGKHVEWLEPVTDV